MFALVACDLPDSRLVVCVRCELPQTAQRHLVDILQHVVGHWQQAGATAVAAGVAAF